MCGIIGILSQAPVNQAIYDGLLVLQHRGQDAAGILTCDDKRVHLRKDNGQVRDVFQERHMLGLKGNMGIGHVRYPTAGCDSPAEAQPFYVAYRCWRGIFCARARPNLMSKPSASPSRWSNTWHHWIFRAMCGNWKTCVTG
jgi:glutamine phosphoribosylpyrophosphate amidotransferase